MPRHADGRNRRQLRVRRFDVRLAAVRELLREFRAKLVPKRVNQKHAHASSAFPDGRRHLAVEDLRVREPTLGRPPGRFQVLQEHALHLVRERVVRLPRRPHQFIDARRLFKEVTLRLLEFTLRAVDLVHRRGIEVEQLGLRGDTAGQLPVHVLAPAHQLGRRLHELPRRHVLAAMAPYLSLVDGYVPENRVVVAHPHGLDRE